VTVDGDLAAAGRALETLMRRLTRVPRKRHGVAPGE
jgi:hypothetical protein